MSGHALVLHIGEAKTGSTALQNFLYTNKELLEKVGWCYPDFSKDLPEYEECVRNEKSKNGRYFYGLNHRDGIDCFSPKWEKIWKCIEKKIEYRNVIISAEEISVCNSMEILEEARKRFKKVQVILYIRRQDLFVESFWAECIKGSLADTFMNYMTRVENGEDGILDNLYYYTSLKKLEAIVGVGNVIVRVYEKGQFKGNRGDVISDFFDALNISLDWERAEEPAYTNERLGAGCTEIKRIINGLFEKYNIESKWQVSNDIKDVAEKFPSNNKREVYFNPEERRAFLDKFKIENELVAREYLGREDGILFYDNEMDMLQNMIRATELEEDLIKTFTYMLIKHNEENNLELAYLMYKNKLMVQNIIQMYKRDKRLVYFAAGQRCEQFLKNYQFSVDCILDNDLSIVGKEIRGVNICSPTEIDDWRQCFVVVTCLQTDEIEMQLATFGLKKYEDYILLTEII